MTSAIAPGTPITDGQFIALRTLATPQAVSAGAGADATSFNTGSVFEELVCINVTAVSGSITFEIDTLGGDGVWYPIWTQSPATSAPGKVVVSLGNGAAISTILGAVQRLAWTVSGGGSATFTASIMGR